jgi:hypothetical protein
MRSSANSFPEFLIFKFNSEKQKAPQLAPQGLEIQSEN